MVEAEKLEKLEEDIHTVMRDCLTDFKSYVESLIERSINEHDCRLHNVESACGRLRFIDDDLKNLRKRLRGCVVE